MPRSSKLSERRFEENAVLKRTPFRRGRVGKCLIGDNHLCANGFSNARYAT